MMNPFSLSLLAVAAAPALCLAAPVQQDPALQTDELENGLHYIIRHTTEPKGRGSLRLLIRTGSLNEAPEQAGISHLLEHMVFNGSRHYKRGELIPAMQSLGLGYGGDANAFTSYADTFYSLDLPNLQPETVHTAFTILRDFADGATLEPDALEHERGIVISEKNLSDSATYRAGIEQMGQMAEGSRLTETLPIGREEVIRTVSAEALRRYYEEHYVPGLMTVIFTGDVDPAQAETWVREAFADMPARPLPPTATPGQLTNTGASERLIANPELATTNLYLAVMNPYRPKPNTEEQRIDELPLQLACIMLGDRLAQRTKPAHAPIAKAGAGLENILNAAEGVCINLSTMPTRWPEAMNLAVDELRKATTYGFTASELRASLARLEQAYDTAISTEDSTPADAVANALVSHLQSGKTYTTQAEAHRIFRLGAERLLQHPELCREALAKALDFSRMKLCMMGKLPENMQPQQLREAFDAAMQRPIAPDEEKQVASADLERDFGAPATVTERHFIEKPSVTTLRLSNGVRVNLKPEPAARGKIAVNAAVDGGTLRVAQPGLSLLIDSVMTHGGIDSVSEEELSRAFAGHDVGVGFQSDALHYNLGGFTTPEDLELELKLIIAHLLHPGYREDGLLLVKRRLPALRNRIETTPETFFEDASRRMVYGDDPHFVAPTPEQVAPLTTEDVRRAAGPYLQSGAIELSLVGDFELEPTIELLQRTFGAIPERRAEFDPLPEGAAQVKLQPWGQEQTRRYRSAVDKTVVARLIGAGSGRDFKRNYRIQLLCDVLQSRLFAAIRAELGESYAPQVLFTPQMDFDNAALITVLSSGTSRNVEIVNRAMDAVLADLATGNISDEECALAVKPAVSSILRSYTDAGFWAQAIRTIQSEPESLPRTLDWYPEVQSVTAAELNELARELFGGPNIDKLNVVPQL